MGSGFCKVRSLKEPVEQNSVTIYVILERNQTCLSVDARWLCRTHFDFAFNSDFQFLAKKSFCISFHHTALMTACVTVSLKGLLITLCQQNLAISDSDVRRAVLLVTWLELESVVSLNKNQMDLKCRITKANCKTQYQSPESGEMLSLSAQSVFRPALISRSVENIKLLKTASLPRFCKSVNLWALHINIWNGSKSNNKWFFLKKAFVNIEWHKTHTLISAVTQVSDEKWTGQEEISDGIRLGRSRWRGQACWLRWVLHQNMSFMLNPSSSMR